jgi:O-acetyl-ADP-ribose deacetylase
MSERRIAVKSSGEGLPFELRRGREKVAKNSYLGGRVEAVVGDITAEKVNVIVNAANSGLLGGGGVDGAIHRAGGPSIIEECRGIRKTMFPDGLPPGRAVATGGGRLKAGHVIHAVGPVWHGGGHGEDELLRLAYLNSLLEAEKLGAGSIAFPAISTGAYGFPTVRAAGIVSAVLAGYFASERPIRLVRLVFFSRDDLETFTANTDLPATGP